MCTNNTSLSSCESPQPKWPPLEKAGGVDSSSLTLCGEHRALEISKICYIPGMRHGVQKGTKRYRSTCMHSIGIVSISQKCEF